MLNLNFSQQSIIGMSAALVAGLFITFVYASWQWRADWILAHQNLGVSSAIAKVDEVADMIAAIPNEHLFGQSFSKTGEMPITNLQLQVTGIVKIENEQSGSFSKAYISIAGQPSKIYQMGDSLPYGVKVYDITSDAVILENDGHLEKLVLSRERLQFKPRNEEGL